jgi:hypothetical protein
MFSSYTLAVVREGDLPIIIQPWTLEPVKLRPYEPARPYFFLVQKPGSTVWQSLYYVIRKPSDESHSNVTNMASQPAPRLRVSTTACSGPKCASSGTSTALCPADHFSRLFQMRSMQWNIYIRDSKHTVSFPVETITDGILRCGGGCGDATRSNMIHFIVGNGYPGHTGYFYPVDNEYICKVATDESVPAVFAVLPQYAQIIAVVADVISYPSDEFVEVYYITSTLDRCALLYYHEYSSEWGGMDPKLAPQFTAEQMKSGTSTAVTKLRYLQATFDAGKEICDANFDTYECDADPHPPPGY